MRIYTTKELNSYNCISYNNVYVFHPPAIITMYTACEIIIKKKKTRYIYIASEMLYRWHGRVAWSALNTKCGVYNKII